MTLEPETVQVKHHKAQGALHPRKLKLAIGPVNGWPTALKWEQFWGIKAVGSLPCAALASVTTALRYFSKYIIGV